MSQMYELPFGSEYDGPSETRPLEPVEYLPPPVPPIVSQFGEFCQDNKLPLAEVGVAERRQLAELTHDYVTLDKSKEMVTMPQDITPFNLVKRTVRVQMGYYYDRFKNIGLPEESSDHKGDREELQEVHHEWTAYYANKVPEIKVLGHLMGAVPDTTNPVVMDALNDLRACYGLTLRSLAEVYRQTNVDRENAIQRHQAKFDRYPRDES